MAGSKAEAAAKVARSEIQFPYVDLEGAIDVAKAIISKGGVPLERDQLAAALGLVANSGNYSIRTAAAKQFGLTETFAGKTQLTPLGYEILDPPRAASAKVRAFLEVPLYKRVYDEYRGKQLPPRPHGLESAFVSFGVAPKQKDKARQVFERSARMAGFFPTASEDRLVAPAVADDEEDSNSSSFSPAGSATLSVVPAPRTPRHHPFIEGLLERLPPPDTDWPADRQAKWLEAAANIFSLLYKSDGGNLRVVVEDGGQ